MATQGCPCGFLGHPRRPCHCTPHQIKLYRGRISGPLLDRIDIHVEVPAVSARELMRRRTGPCSSAISEGARADSGAVGEGATAVIRSRVEAAREVQLLRFANHPGIHANAQMGLSELEEFCPLEDATRAFLQRAIESLSLSARAAHRSLRVARTIADLAGAELIGMEHVAEAVQYQGIDRELT
jgi:magnesium chelatase family protein